MENKYYTPTIEEFHIGFEYEKFNNRLAMYKIDGNYINTNWHRFKYDLKAIRLSQLGTHLFEKTIRVKYLDREDIESLDWENYDNIYNTIRWDYKEYILVFYKKDERYLIFRNCGIDNIQTVFNGFIKNKSELIKLMKQLGINE